MIRMRAEATFLFEFGLKFAGGGLPFRERGRCRAGPQLYFRFWAVSVQSAACAIPGRVLRVDERV